VDLHPGIIEGAKESEAQDVVHVEVGEKYVDPGQFFRQLLRERPNASPRVQNDHVAVWSSQAHA
jgi:hypothetical protein